LHPWQAPNVASALNFFESPTILSPIPQLAGTIASKRGMPLALYMEWLSFMAKYVTA